MSFNRTAPPSLLDDASPGKKSLQDRAGDLRLARRSSAAPAQKVPVILPPPKTVDKAPAPNKPDPQTPSTWAPSWKVAYEKVSDGGTVAKNRLEEMLKAAGHRNTWPKLVDQVSEKLAPYNVLSTSTVYQFFVQYESRIKEDLRNAFEKRAGYDKMISIDTLEELVFELGYTPLPTTVSALLHEAGDALKIKPVSEDHINQALFDKCIELLVQQDGFSTEELRALRLAFKRFDLDGSGAVEVDEIGAILVWMGYWSGSDVIRTLMAQELEVVGTHSLDIDGFVHLMRRHRACEYNHIVDLFEKFDRDGTTFLGPGEIMRLFQKLGLSLRPETLFEVVGDLELNYEEFNFENFWKILELIRHREGFCSDELRDISTTFDHFDRFRCGELVTRSVPNALRWLGYLLGRGQAERVDWRREYGHRGRICEIEFVKIVRDHAEGDLRQARKVFRSFAQDSGAGRLPIAVLEVALRKCCSYYPKEYRPWLEENLPELLSGGSKGLDFEEFRRIFRACRDRVRDRLRKNRGFSDEEISRFKHHMAQQRIKMGGEGESAVLPPAALIELFRTLCPAVGTSPEVHGMLKKALSYHQVSRGMDWNTFLMVMRTYTDLQEEEQACGAHLVKDELGVPATIVEDYLDIFQQYFQKGPKSLSDKDLALLYNAGRDKAEQLDAEQYTQLKDRLCLLHEKSGAAGSVQKFVAYAKELRAMDLGAEEEPPLSSSSQNPRSLRGKVNRLLPESEDD